MGTVFRFLYMKRILILVTAIVTLASAARASSPEYIALADSADNYIKMERWQDAENTILSALKLEPGNFSNSLLLSNLGVVRTNLGKMDGALEAFRLGLSIAPRSSVIRTNRARTLLHLRRYDEALKDLDETLEIDSTQTWPLQMRGLLRIGKNDIEGAKADFTRLSKISFHNASAMAGLARVAEIEGKYDEALEYYDKAVDYDDNPETRFSHIILKINLEKYSEAGEDIRKAIEKYPEVPDFYLARGYLHRLNYRNQEAEIDKKIALDKGADPQLVEQFLPKIGK